MKKKNIFTVGPPAQGESFFGRTKEIKKLEDEIFTNKGVIHLVGAPRIGKSSLVNKVVEKNRKKSKKIICISIDMSPCMDAYEFWVSTLAGKTADALSEADLLENFREYCKKIESISATDERWYAKFCRNFGRLLKKIKEEKLRVVLIIDEFDAAERLFGGESYYYSLLRSIFYETSYSVNGVLVSRRRLHLFEAKCEYIHS